MSIKCKSRLSVKSPHINYCMNKISLKDGKISNSCRMGHLVMVNKRLVGRYLLLKVFNVLFIYKHNSILFNLHVPPQTVWETSVDTYICKTAHFSLLVT